MPKFIVKGWVDGYVCDWWEFEDRKESLNFWKEKAHNITKERIADNHQALIKFEDEDEYAYTWFDVEHEWEGLRKSKKWREVKEERTKNED